MLKLFWRWLMSWERDELLRQREERHKIGNEMVRQYRRSVLNGRDGKPLEDKRGGKNACDRTLSS